MRQTVRLPNGDTIEITLRLDLTILWWAILNLVSEVFRR